MQSTLLRSTRLNSTRLSCSFSRYYSSAKETTKQATEQTKQKASQVGNQVSSAANTAKEAVQDQISSRGPISSEKAYNSTSEATTRASGIVKDFISPIPNTSTTFAEASSDFTSTASILAKSARDTFNSLTGNNTTTTTNQVEKMSSNNINASGLTPEESRKLPVIQPSKEDEPIMEAIKTLYSCKPRESTYDIFAENATFHDPLSIAEGIARIRVQYNGLVKLFPRAEVNRFDLLESPKSLTNGLLINQDVTYWRSENTNDEPFKKMNSLLTVIKDNNGKVLRLTEEWNHDKVSDSNNAGFFGVLNEGRKKAFAALSMPFVDQTAPMDRK